MDTDIFRKMLYEDSDEDAEYDGFMDDGDDSFSESYSAVTRAYSDPNTVSVVLW